MSLTPGFILADDGDIVGLTLADVAVIVAEWDAYAPTWKRGSGPDDVVIAAGDLPEMRLHWDHYAWSPQIAVVRGSGDRCYVRSEDIAEMRAVLEAAR